MDAGLDVAVSRVDDASVAVRLHGELDIATAGQLRTALRGATAAPTRLVDVDCSDLAFLDLAGTRVLLAAHEELAGRGGELVLRRVGPPARRLLALLALEDGPRVVEP